MTEEQSQELKKNKSAMAAKKYLLLIFCIT